MSGTAIPDVLPASADAALPTADAVLAVDDEAAEETVAEELVEETTEIADAEGEDETTLAADDRGYILTITEKGFGKRTPVLAYRLQRRGGLGLSNVKITEKNGAVVGIAHVGDDDQLLLITEQGMMIRTGVGSIRIAGRKTQGVRVINIDETDTVVAAVKVIERPEDESGPEDEENPESPETPTEEPVH